MSTRGAHILILLSDAYGGFGGISQYNRDMIEALCSLDEVASVEALPRVATEPVGPLPDKLRFDLSGRGSHLTYARAALRRGLFGPKPDFVICGHINLLPICVPIARLRGAPLILQVHGIDAWTPTSRTSTNLMTGQVDRLLSVSRVTADRYLSWARAPRDDVQVLPNTVDLARYGPGPKATDLVEKFGLRDRKVLMTMGRLAGRERYKGFDRIIEAMPELNARDDSIVYLIAGDGDDADRLREKAAALGVSDRVIFTGFVPEDRKADYFRLADVYVMPSAGEGFGIVCLEAMACGVPTIASRTDGSYEAVRNGEIGMAVDPLDRQGIMRAIFASLDLPRAVPPGLAYFAFPEFRERLRNALFGTSSAER